MNRDNSSCIRTSTRIVLTVSLMTLTAGLLFVGIYFPRAATDNYGPMSPDLSLIQRISLPVKVVLEHEDLVNPFPSPNENCIFSITEGESVYQITARLQESAFIKDAGSMLNYMIYTGIDRQIQTGSFCIQNPSTAMQVANMLADPQSRMIKVVIFPGWRLEEIGQSIEALGLNLNKEELLLLNQDPSNLFVPEEFGIISTLEGVLTPGEYMITKETLTVDFVQMALNKFAEKLSPETLNQVNNSGLDLQQVLIIASIVQREAQQYDEMPVIASVFLNRLRIGMRLESDPTVQYALGFRSDLNTWWKVPLTYGDLKIDSPYNTYVYPGLPPTPICSPSIEAIESVLEAPATEYLFFRAACDNSGYHQFSLTYDEHRSKACP